MNKEGLVALCKLSSHTHIVGCEPVVLVTRYHPYVEGLIVGVTNNADLLIFSAIEGESLELESILEREENKQNKTKKA